MRTCLASIAAWPRTALLCPPHLPRLPHLPTLTQGEDAADKVFSMLDALQGCVMDVDEANRMAPKSTRRNTFDMLVSNGKQGVRRLRKTMSSHPAGSAPSSRTLTTGSWAVRR
jgi:hypothetical protein